MNYVDILPPWRFCRGKLQVSTELVFYAQSASAVISGQGKLQTYITVNQHPEKKHRNIIAFGFCTGTGKSVVSSVLKNNFRTDVLIQQLLIHNSNITAS